jgi:hypothetical protein
VSPGEPFRWGPEALRRAPGASEGALDAEVTQLSPSQGQHPVRELIKVPHLASGGYGLNHSVRPAVAGADHPEHASGVHGHPVRAEVPKRPTYLPLARRPPTQRRARDSDSGEIVVRVALDEEYRDSKRERRSAVSMAWAVARLEVVLPRGSDGSPGKGAWAG